MTSKIDLILAPLTYTRSRSEGVKYLRPLAQEKRCLFINSDASEAAVSWLIYVKPFTMGLWLMILFVALVNAIFINFVNYIYGKRKQVISLCKKDSTLQGLLMDPFRDGHEGFWIFLKVGNQ